MSLLVCLPSSSFFLSQYLTQRIVGDDFTQAEFSYAIKSDNVAALLRQVKTLEIGSHQWLLVTKLLAKTEKEYALALGRFYLKRSNEEKNNALLESAIMWLNQSILLKSEQGEFELANLYFKQKSIKEALNIINNYQANGVKDTELNMLMLATSLAIYQGNRVQINDYVNQLINIVVTINSTSGKGYSKDVNSSLIDFISELNKFSILSTKQQTHFLNNEFNRELARSADYHEQPKNLLGLNRKPEQCFTSIQLFATNLEHLRHLEQLIQQFKTQQPLGKFVCLVTPAYISSQTVNCTDNNNQAIRCDEARWQYIASQVSTRHIGLLLPQGGANVHLGVMYFDEKDNVQVFSHEISHLLGFIDEYPLTKGHDKCQQVQEKPFAHNIAVLNNRYQGDRNKLRKEILANIPWADKIADSTPILQPFTQGKNTSNDWRLGTPVANKNRVGIYAAESCNNVSSQSSKKASDGNYSAYKPLLKPTQLRYFSHEFPAEYLSMIKENRNAFLMPSFHYNIALALFNEGKVNEAKLWLQQAATWETSTARKALITAGGF